MLPTSKSTRHHWSSAILICAHDNATLVLHDSAFMPSTAYFDEKSPRDG